MSPATETAAETGDGRSARRERNRAAVIDAMFALLAEGHHPPSVDDLAERSGVSVSSVYRYFDGLDDLQRETVDRYFERFAPLFEIHDLGAGDLAGRVDRFVGARLALYEAIAPIARFARARAIEGGRLATTLQATRATFTGQIRDHFGPELAALGRAEADDRVALVDSLTSFEAWDLQTSSHARSRRLIARSWTTALQRLL